MKILDLIAELQLIERERGNIDVYGRAAAGREWRDATVKCDTTRLITGRECFSAAAVFVEGE